jgi:hypothetical protein
MKSPNRTSALLSTALVALLGCLVLTTVFSSGGCGGSSTPSDGGPDAGPDAGPDGGPSWSTPVTIDSNVASGLDLVAAVDPQGHPAIAYFTHGPDGGGVPTYPLTLLRETTPGSWSGEVVPAALDGGALEHNFGLGLTFDGQGNPVVSYAGGLAPDDKSPADGRWHFDGYPAPSDSVVARKSGSGWTRYTLGSYSNSFAASGFAVDDQGSVVGLHSSVGVDSTGKVHVVQRDVHYGNDASATAKSNLEYGQFTLSGGSTSKSVGELIIRSNDSTASGACTGGGCVTGTTPLAGGGTYSRMVMANDQPAVSFALGPDTINESQQIWFALRTASSGWKVTRLSAVNGQPGHPPALAYRAGSGYAVAFFDGINGDLFFSSSADGITWPSQAQPVETLGYTGLHPAAAFDQSGNLGLLYSYCRAPTDPTSSCNSSSAQIRFRTATTAVGDLFNAPTEAVDPSVPDATALVVDGNGHYVAIWHDPALGLRMSRRSP